MNKTLLSAIRPLVYVFVIVTAFSLSAKAGIARYGIDNWVVAGGNALLFLVSMIAFFLTARSFQNKNPQAFVRAMYGSFMIKFFLVVVAAFTYIIIVKNDVSKMALGVCALLYIIYTIFEIRGLNRLLKANKNG